MIRVRALAAAFTALLLVPAAAHATTVTVSGSDGTPLPLTVDAPPVSTRDMDVTLARSVQAPEAKAHVLRVLGPDGTVVIQSPTFCWVALPQLSGYPNYRGNGVYTVEIDRYGTITCNPGTKLPTLRYQYRVDASVALTAPQQPVLTRATNDRRLNRHEIGIDVNPGGVHEVRYARGGTIGADGAISGPSRTAAVDHGAGKAGVTFADGPGTYVFVGRAARDGYFTPWSAPVTIDVKAPFDLGSLAATDARGPAFRIGGKVREQAASGRVSIAIARGKRGGAFRTVGRPRIGRKGAFSLGFRTTGSGTYRVRVSYKGNGSVSAGQAVQTVRLKRF